MKEVNPQKKILGSANVETRIHESGPPEFLNKKTNFSDKVKGNKQDIVEITHKRSKYELDKVITKEKKPFVTTEEAVTFLKQPDTSRTSYSIETAHQEKPFIHETHEGNVLQVVRFGLKSNNFKNRLDEQRTTDPELDTTARQISGLHVGKGGSYQGKDSICLSTYNETMGVLPHKVLFLVNPSIQVWGEDKREATGYGYGIAVQKVEGKYEVGNEKAYPTEVIACNIISPADNRAIVLTKDTEILKGMRSVVREQAKLYSQEKKKDISRANEDMLANVRLLAELNGDSELDTKANLLQDRLYSLSVTEVITEVAALQKTGLQKFVGDKELNETNLRTAISERFNITILEK